MSLGAYGDEGNAASVPHCSDCGDPFHFDDVGGYNPPCNCGNCDGTLCRACCHAADWENDDDGGWAINPTTSDSLWDSDPASPEGETR